MSTITVTTVTARNRQKVANKLAALGELTGTTPANADATPTETVEEANAKDTEEGIADPKAEVPNLDAAPTPTTTADATVVVRSDDPKTGDEVDLNEKPLTEAAHDYLTAKAEGRPPYRYFTRWAALVTLAKAKIERSEKGEQLVLAEVKILVGEGQTLVCSNSKCEKTFKEVWSFVIGNSPDANVEPIEGLPTGISALVMRHKDGAPKVSGAHIELVTKRDSLGKPVTYTFPKFCGSRYYLGKNPDGSFKNEYASNSSCLGKAVQAASSKLPARADGGKPTAYTYDALGVKEIVEWRTYVKEQTAKREADRVAKRRTESEESTKSIFDMFEEVASVTAKPTTALERAKNANDGTLPEPHGEGEFRGRGFERGQGSRENNFRGR